MDTRSKQQFYNYFRPYLDDPETLEPRLQQAQHQLTLYIQHRYMHPTRMKEFAKWADELRAIARANATYRTIRISRALRGA